MIKEYGLKERKRLLLFLKNEGVGIRAFAKTVGLNYQTVYSYVGGWPVNVKTHGKIKAYLDKRMPQMEDLE